MKYLDYTTNPLGEEKIYDSECGKETDVPRVGTVFYNFDKLGCTGDMEIKEVELEFYAERGEPYTLRYDISGEGKKIRRGGTLIMSSFGGASAYKPENNPDPSKLINFYYYPSNENFEYSYFGEGRIIYNTTPDASSPFSYEYYLTDHLGSTRMVINDAGEVVEAVRYEPYGIMEKVGGINTPALAVREKFTGKEYDNEGEVNGVGGIDAYYFDARMYDPEIGLFMATDAASQYSNAYSYTGGNPIIFIDEDGNFAFLAAPIIANALISAATDLTLQLAMNGGKLNEVRWGSVAFSGVSGAATSGFSQLAAARKLGTFLMGRGAGAFISRSLIEGGIFGAFGTIGELVDRAGGRESKPISDIWISAGLGSAVQIGKGMGTGLVSRMTGGSGSFDPGFDALRRHYGRGGLHAAGGTIPKESMPKNFISNTIQEAGVEQVKNRWVAPIIAPEPAAPNSGNADMSVTPKQDGRCIDVITKDGIQTICF